MCQSSALIGKLMIITVTGHRPNKLGGYKIPNPIYNSVIESLTCSFSFFKPEQVITGMALGVDQWAAEICIEFGIPFIAAMPFPDQEAVWPAQSQAKFQYLLSRASHVITVSEGGFSPKKMHVRNAWMIDRCHLVLAVWDGSSGGTASAVSYAKRINRPIHFAHFLSIPKDFAETVYVCEADLATSTPETVTPTSNKETPKTDVSLSYKRLIELD